MNIISNYRRRKVIVFLFVLLVLILMCVYGWKKNMTEAVQAETGRGLISLFWKKNGEKQEIQAFKQGNVLYFFMPGYINPEDVCIESEGGICITSEEQRYVNGDSLDGAELGAEYAVVQENGLQQKVVILKGAKLPVISIHTASGDMEYIHADKENSESGYMEIWDASGKRQDIIKIKSIAGRGNTSWDAAKKSYTIKLDETKNLLGMDSGKTWVLNANYYDGSYIRNAVGFQVARAGGILYVPDSEFSELYINNEYMGLYQIMEKVEVAPSRVDIGSDYLLEIDYIERAVEEERYIMLPNSQPVVIHSSEKKADVEGVQQFFDEFSKRTELGEIPWENIDAESFAKMFVMEELLQDMDFGYTSHYLYLDMKRKILSDGTVWDMDNTMGRGTEKEAKRLFAVGYDLKHNNLSRWYAKMYEHEEFRELAAQEYWENFRPAVIEMIEGGIEEQSRKIEKSIQMDKKRFPEIRSIFMGEASAEKNREYLVSYLQGKIEILDECFSENEVKTNFYAELPTLEKQESSFNLDVKGPMGQEMDIMGFVLKYRFLFLVAVMVAFYMLLYIQCKKTGK